MEKCQSYAESVIVSGTGSRGEIRWDREAGFKVSRFQSFKVSKLKNQVFSLKL
jgi:hypothetical protein